MMIASQLLQTGIIQFGLFVKNGQELPYRLQLDMLPAYPELLQNVVYRGVQTLAGIPTFDRLVAHADAVPLASALSLNTGISLVYSRGRGETPVHDLVGAYDVGHPACLLVNSITPDMKQWLADAERVGLNIHTVIEVIATGHQLQQPAQTAIFTLTEIIHALHHDRHIPQPLVDQITIMINHRRGSTTP
ncbi:MAG: hypothetical protein ACFE0Q_04145 [Anaerolineae bacterium]